MTNFTKKRTTGNDSGSDAPLSASDQDPQTLEELLERNKELERRLRKYKDKHKSSNSRATIKPITRPKGEAGSRKRGFILYNAMGMDKVENGPVVYDRMRNSVRKACIKVGLNLGAHYKHQDHEKLGQVFLLVRNSYPYLTTARFPHNWAIADMVKGYIAGTRKEHNRQAREDQEEHSRGPTSSSKSKRSSADSDVDDDREWPPTGSKPTAKKAFLPKSSSTSKSKRPTGNSDVDDDLPPSGSKPTSPIPRLPTTKSKKQPTGRTGWNSEPSSTAKSRKLKRSQTDADIFETNGPEDSSAGPSKKRHVQPRRPTHKAKSTRKPQHPGSDVSEYELENNFNRSNSEINDDNDTGHVDDDDEHEGDE